MSLPIDAYVAQIAQAVLNHQVIILVGETGSGKSTETPQILLHAGFGHKGMIGVTEPRRIAAITLSDYVGETVGRRQVGYKIRHEDETGPETEIKYMTEGILLREMQADPELSRYEVIVVDEAHERNLNTDFLLGLLKRLLQTRTDLKVIVASATIDAAKFSQYFDGAPIIEVSGRMYPVEVSYEPISCGFGHKLSDLVADRVKMLHATEGAGDVLVFMTGREDIGDTVESLEDVPGLIALPLYGEMPADEQKRAFRRYPGLRKVVIATNIAETSITVDGVVYVIDSGLIKQSDFDPATGIGSLEVVEHSQAGCDQRKGRAGRTQAGECVRLYSKDNFDGRPDYTKPEILRTSLAGVVLAMKAMGIKEVEGFDFLDQPDPEAFHAAHDHLIALGALTAGNGLSPLGWQMAKLPVEPHKARQLLAAVDYKCLEEMAIIIAMTSTGKQPFIWPRELPEQLPASRAQAPYRHESSDHLTLLKLFRAWEEAGQDKKWCHDRWINAKALEEAERILEQLLQIVRREGFDYSCGAGQDEVLKAVTAGLIDNVCVRGGGYFKRGLETGIMIHPSSSARDSGADLIVANEIVQTVSRRGTATYARCVSGIKAEWLEEIAPERITHRDDGLFYSEALELVVTRETTLWSGETVIGCVETPAEGPEATRVLAKAIAKASIISSLRQLAVAEKAMATRYKLRQVIDRRAFELIVESIVAEQLHGVTTLSDALCLDLSLPDWLDDAEEIHREALRMYPASFEFNNQTGQIQYTELTPSFLAVLCGLRPLEVALITADDLPEMPGVTAIKVKTPDNWTVVTLDEAKDKLYGQHPVIPFGTWTSGTYGWKSIREERPQSFPENVMVSGMTLPVVYQEAARIAEIILTEEQAGRISGEERPLPPVSPYIWRIRCELAGRVTVVSDWGDIPHRISLMKREAERAAAERIVAAEKQVLRSELLELIRTLESLTGEHQFHYRDFLTEYHGDTPARIKTATLQVGEQVGRYKNLPKNEAALQSLIEEYFQYCPICMKQLVGGRCLGKTGMGKAETDQHKRHMIRFAEGEGGEREYRLLEIMAGEKVAARIIVRTDGTVEQRLTDQLPEKLRWSPLLFDGELEVVDHSADAEIFMTPDEYANALWILDQARVTAAKERAAKRL